MEWNERLATTNAMKKFGGGFVQALAMAWQLADDDNSARIEAAFPEYVAKYRDMAAKAVQA